MSRPDVFYGASGYGDLADTNRFTLWGAGTPEAYIQADVGSMYMDTATGGVWTKTTGTGNTGWAQLAAGAASTSVLPVSRNQNFSVIVDPTGYSPIPLGDATVLPASATLYAISATYVFANGSGVPPLAILPYGSSFPPITGGQGYVGIAVNGVYYPGPLLTLDGSTGRVVVPFTPGAYNFSAGDTVELAVGQSAVTMTPPYDSASFILAVYVALT